MLRRVSLHNGVHKHKTQKDLSDRPKDSIYLLVDEPLRWHTSPKSLLNKFFFSVLLVFCIVLAPCCTAYTFQGWEKGLGTYHRVPCHLMALEIKAFLQARNKHKDGTQPSPDSRSLII